VNVQNSHIKLIHQIRVRHDGVCGEGESVPQYSSRCLSSFHAPPLRGGKADMTVSCSSSVVLLAGRISVNDQRSRFIIM